MSPVTTEPLSAPLPPSNQDNLNLTLGACFSFLRIPQIHMEAGCTDEG